jgi:hypothetical protein
MIRSKKKLIPAITADAGIVMNQATTIFFATPQIGGIMESIGVVKEEG